MRCAVTAPVFRSALPVVHTFDEYRALGARKQLYSVSECVETKMWRMRLLRLKLLESSEGSMLAGRELE